MDTTSDKEYTEKERYMILEFSRRIFRLSDPKISEELKEAYKVQTIPLSEYSQQIRLKAARYEGKEEGLEEVARSMLADGLSVETIRKYTGFNEEKILALR